MTFADLFCGIGGFRLGLERAGMQCAWACEIDDFCRRVYLKHWPETEPFYDDIRTITNPPTVDLVCGGFPCQPFSVAGKQLGTDDPRNLWPEMLRVIGLVRPSWVLGENVPGIGDYLDTVVSDLEARGFEVVPLEIEAAAVGANHRRARVWIVAYAVGNASSSGLHRINGRGTGAELENRCADVAHASGNGRQSRDGGRPIPDEIGNHQGALRGPLKQSRPCDNCADVPDADSCGQSGNEAQYDTKLSIPTISECGWFAESRLGRGFDGIPSWLDGSWEHGVPRVATGVKDRVNRLKSLGNAVVPQVVEWIGRRIMEATL